MTNPEKLQVKGTNFTLDYDEPIPSVVDRLTKEHKNLNPKLKQVQELSKDGSLEEAIRLLNAVKAPLLRHAVEEEARLMRVTMSEFEQSSEQSIGIMRFHRNLAAFMKYTLPNLSSLPERAARREISIFVGELLKHHREEEELAFPLALKADSIQKARVGRTVVRGLLENHPTEHKVVKSALLGVPASIVEEHEEIFSELKALAAARNKTGEAVESLLNALTPHFEAEDELAMPLLGALAPLSSGKAAGGFDEVIALEDKLRKKMPFMLSEHKKIGVFISRVRTAANKEKNARALSILGALEHHAKIEEEVLYPAALLAGVAAKATADKVNTQER